jgi:rubredoxin
MTKWKCINCDLEFVPVRERPVSDVSCSMCGLKNLKAVGCRPSAVATGTSLTDIGSVLLKEAQS